MSTQYGQVILQGILLGWSVAWSPGPINLEMLRRGVKHGFFPAFIVGFGATNGDFLWALVANFGAGLVAVNPSVQWAMAVTSSALLVVIAGFMVRGCNEKRRSGWHEENTAVRFSRRQGYLLGFTMSLTSPWNVAFWFAVAGQSASLGLGLAGNLVCAAAVLTGAGIWVLLFTLAASFGGKLIPQAWHRHAELVSAVLMVGFAVRPWINLQAG